MTAGPVRPWQAANPCNCTTTATCGDLSPAIADLNRLMCDLPVGHPGAHQASDGTSFPTRWIRNTDRDARLARMEAAPDAPESPPLSPRRGSERPTW